MRVLFKLNIDELRGSQMTEKPKDLKQRTETAAAGAEHGDFSTGSVYSQILSLAGPIIIAQLVQLLYNIVDRIYIGHLPGASSLALTGLGLTFPVITIILAFTNLFGTGGTPLFSIARGSGDKERAELIQGNSFALLCVTSIILMIFCYAFLKPMLYMFGASDASFPYARDYLTIYLIGTPLVMIATGMNGFINAQGFPWIGMVTVLAGAVTNIILDPVFIFVFGMGVAGAATASVISQLLSALWALRFFRGPKTTYKITKESMQLDRQIDAQIAQLGTAGFIMQATNGAVQIACNATLLSAGGDIYVGIMTVLTSLRDLSSLPMQGLGSAAQPVIGYNYGAGKHDRITRSIVFMTVINVIFGLIVWLVLFLFPKQMMQIFNSDPELLAKGTPALHLYFFGFFMMAFQASGQSIFVGLGLSKQAVFFSLFRKIIIVVPLTLILPHVMNLGVNGVFIAEPISNLVGGLACYLTMAVTVRKLLKEPDDN